LNLTIRTMTTPTTSLTLQNHPVCDREEWLTRKIPAPAATADLRLALGRDGD